MVLDTSARMAILCDEDERSSFTLAIEEADARLISAATLVEISVVLEVRFGPEAVRELDLFLHRAKVQVVAVDEEQALIARRAYSRFGRGRHAASLNFGDCFAYALAYLRDEPLLFKGQDLSRTDIAPVGAANAGA